VTSQFFLKRLAKAYGTLANTGTFYNISTACIRNKKSKNKYIIIRKAQRTAVRPPLPYNFILQFIGLLRHRRLPAQEHVLKISLKKAPASN